MGSRAHRTVSIEPQPFTHFHQLGIKEFSHIPSVIDDVVSWNAFPNTYQFTF